jgi:predicted transcriptional regulator
MSIVIDLSPAVEARLRDKALQRGQDMNLMVAELLEVVLTWDEEDLAESIAAIQEGLDDFEAGRFQSVKNLRGPFKSALVISHSSSSPATLSVQEILASTRGSWGQKTMEEVDRQLADQRQLDWGE